MYLGPLRPRMTTIETISIELLSHDNVASLSLEDQELIAQARAAAGRAYAPYSRFMVGAALRMANGTVVTGNNQENASFPAGICAERTALHAAMSARTDGIVHTMAVAVPNASTDAPVPPCGICRQALAEQEHRQGGPLRLLLASANGMVYELASAGTLLPLSFNALFLKP